MLKAYETQIQDPNPGYSNADSILGCKEILDQLKAHDERMRKQSYDWALAKAMYTTNYWRFIKSGESSKTGQSATLQRLMDVEVNRMFPTIGAYLAALYPRANRSIVGADPMGHGDPEKMQLCNNRWLASQRIHQRVMTGFRQALLYPGCGAKVGYSPGHGSPMDRVWLRVIPWWEIVLDHNVSDPEDERFRGHVFYQPKQQVEDRYGLKNLHGSPREDFLAQADRSGTKNQRDQSARENSNEANSDADAFVRVLEICNLIDKYKDPETGVELPGRFEVYILNQPGNTSKKPVYCGAMPFAKFDGSPLAHICPLIFNHEPEFPFRGIPHSARMLPQFQELNAYRAFMALSTRKDARQYLTKEGAIETDMLTKIAEGEEGFIAQVQKDFPGAIDQAIVPMPQQRMSINIDSYMGYVENDIARISAQSPQARGEITKATAFEIQTVQQYTESEYGMHAAIKDHWLAEILRIFGRALIAAMQDTGDSAGAFKNDSLVKLSTIGAILDDSPEPAGESLDEAQASVVASAQGSVSPFVTEMLSDTIGEDVLAPDGIIPAQTIKMVDNRGNPIEITVADLDAEFEISFVEGGRTPLTDAAMQQNLMILMQPYSTLWQASVKGGPDGVFARAYMQVMAERFNLPKDLYPGELEARVERATRAGEAIEQPEQPDDTAELVGLLKNVMDMPPEKGLQVLATLFKNDPKMTQAISEISKLPPDQQLPQIQEIVAGVMQSIQVKQTPAEEQPQQTVPQQQLPPGPIPESSS